MPRYQSYPQRPDEIATPFNQPDQVSIISAAESILIGAYSRDVRLRDTCREFLGWDVERSKPKPPGDVAYCTGCHEWHNVRDFTPDARKANGRDSRCRSCESKRQKRRRLRGVA